MRNRMIFAALALAALVVPARTRAASDLPWSISALGGYARYSDRWFFPTDSLADAPVFGARLGRHFGELWTLEAAGSYGKTHGVKRDGSDGEDVTVLNGSLSLMAQLTPPNKLGSLYLLGGMGYTRYNADASDQEYHYGVLEGALGWTKSMNDHWSLRVEARNLLNLPEKNYGTANKADQQFWGGLTYDFGGKPKDTDGDGVFDKKDKCPDTPKGATVDAKGCPSDADGDGVWDGIDQCPNTPKGATVDATGCPKDADGDGVFDGLDQCPNTPAGLKVDANGCPIEITEKETELFDTGMIRLQNVNFETGKADLLPESFNALDQVGVILSKWPQLKIEVGGHTDSRGTNAKNQALSEARAQSVRDYLTGHFSGIQADQLTAKGYGESKPLVKDTNALNMAKNRRVEFKVLNRDVLKKEIERRRMLTK